LWSANWVNQYFVPLNVRVPSMPTAVASLLQTLDARLAELNSAESDLLRRGVEEVERLREVLDQSAYRSYAKALALTASLRGVSLALFNSRGAEEIQNYCPEALAGTLSLWLFSRIYHEFMRVAIQRGHKNRRYLPIRRDAEDLAALPPFFCAALFNVVRLYRVLGAEVAIVRELPEGGGNDYSSYSGAIPAFPWIHVEEDGTVSLDHSRLSATPEDVDALREAERNVLARHGLDPIEGATFGALTLEDLDVGVTMPKCLFPANDRLLEAPAELWQNTDLYI
jgi:hypothetical protein